MRFRSSIRNVNTFIKLVASLNLLGKIAWVRLDDERIRFTVVPEQGSQVWAVISIESIFDDDYHVESAEETNAINLEVPLASLHAALRSAQNALRASIRLTKKGPLPLLALTIVVPTPTSTVHRARNLGIAAGAGGGTSTYEDDAALFAPSPPSQSFGGGEDGGGGETTISQEVTVRVLSASVVEGIHEPRCPEPEVHIQLPPLQQLKSVSERFTKLALASAPSSSSFTSNNNKNTSFNPTTQSTAAAAAATTGLLSGASGPKLELSANMHGQLRLGIRTDALSIQSCWEGLTNPELDPGRVEGGEEGVANHPSTRMKEMQGEEGWAVVRVEGRDWGRVLGIGRLSPRVIACFCHDRALILYVYIPNQELEAEESVLTYYVSSYLA